MLPNHVTQTQSCNQNTTSQAQKSHLLYSNAKFRNTARTPTDTCCVLYSNANGFSNKLKELKVVLSTGKYKIACITESLV